MSALQKGCLLFVAVATVSLGRAAVGDEREDLDKLRRALESGRERVEENARDERALLEVMEGLDRSVARTEDERTQAQERARLAKARSLELRSEAQTMSSRLERTQRAMERRVVALYKAGENGFLQVLFSARSPGDWLSRVLALRSLIAADRELVARFRATHEALADSHGRAWRAAAHRGEALDVVRAKGQVLARERSAKRELLASVRSQGEEERVLLRELEEAADALEATLRRMQRSRARGRGGGSFAAQRGSLPAPLEARIRQPFGVVTDRRFGTQTFRKGVEFDASMGQPVHAVAMGQVRYADWFRGYGQIVILDHGGGYFSVSGHLGRIDVEVGQWVNASQRIGVVGETGSLSGPGLYFELREGSQSLDPGLWLDGASEGLH